MIVFTVPMAHFRGIPTYLRERFGVPVIFYDGDVPMSLPEFGGMDTGFNYYHGADPSEYDLVVSNSEGGLPSLLELGAKRAEAVFWGADPEFFAPQAGREAARRLLLRLRGQVPARLDGRDGGGAEPRRAGARVRPRRARLPGRHRTRLARRRHPLQRLQRRRSPPRGSTSTSRAARTPPFPLHRRAGRSSSRARAPRSSRTRTRGSSAGSSRATSCSSSTTPTRRSPSTAACSTTRRRRRRWARGRASASSTSTRTPTGRASCSRSSASASRQAPRA